MNSDSVSIIILSSHRFTVILGIVKINMHLVEGVYDI